jgi:uncharacterized protein YpmB
MLIILAIVLFLFVSFLLFFFKAYQPMLVAKTQVRAIAKSAAGMQKVKKFYHFNRKKTYYAMQGRDNNNQEIYVIVPESGLKITVIKKDQGITEEEAASLIKKSAQKVISTNIGLYDDKPVWEVITKSDSKKFNYYLLDFKTGKNVKKMKGI